MKKEHMRKKMKGAGAMNITVGILMIVTGIVLGTLTIVEGGKLLSAQKETD